MDYVSKWMEVKATQINDFEEIVDFVNSNIFARFRTLRAIISDGRLHFCNMIFSTLLKKYHVHHRVSTLYHLHISGQAKVPNKKVNTSLKKQLNLTRRILV